MEEALEFLMSTRGPGGGGLDSWNSHSGGGGGRGQHLDDQNPFDRSNINQQRFNSQQLPFSVPSVSLAVLIFSCSVVNIYFLYF